MSRLLSLEAQGRNARTPSAGVLRYSENPMCEKLHRQKFLPHLNKTRGKDRISRREWKHSELAQLYGTLFIIKMTMYIL